MPKQNLLIIDFGTSGIKCMLFTANGKLLSKVFTPIQYQDSEGLTGIGREFNASSAWHTIQDMIPACLKEAKVIPDDVTAIAATSQRHGAVFLEKNGEVIYAGPNMDARGVFVQDSVMEGLIDACPPTGCWPPLLYSLCRLLWFKRERSQLYEKIAHVLSISDWIVYQLTGEITTDATQASNTQFMNIQTSQWASEILEMVDISYDLLPEIIESGTMVGNLSSMASKATGLSKSTIVGIGGADTQCALLGSGTIKAGEAGIVAGNTAPVQFVTAKPIIDPNQRLWTGRFLLPKKWVLEANTGTTGSVLSWFVHNLVLPLCPDLEGKPELAYERVGQLASDAKLGSLDVMALLGPTIMDATDMTTIRPGLFLFPPPASPVVKPATIKDFARALFENICYAIRSNLELIQQMANKTLHYCTVAGGLSRSRFWQQMLADITGLKIRCGQATEASGLGAAICAAKAADLYPSIKDAVRNMVVLQPELEPNEERHSRYETYFTRWQTLYRQSANL